MGTVERYCSRADSAGRRDPNNCSEKGRDEIDGYVARALVPAGSALVSTVLPRTRQESRDESLTPYLIELR